MITNNTLKNLAKDILLFLFRAVLSILLIIAFWLFVLSFGKIDLTTKILIKLWTEL